MKIKRKYILIGFIEYEPVEDEEVYIHFTYIGKFKHKQYINKKRKLMGKQRRDVQHELLDHHRSPTLYRTEFAFDKMRFNEKEPDDLPRLSTLRYIYFIIIHLFIKYSHV